MEAPYTRRFSRIYPGLIIILLDQSRSMEEKIPGTHQTKAEYASSAINEIINELIERAPLNNETGERYNYVSLCIFGYSDYAQSLLYNDGQPANLPYVAQNPRGVTTRQSTRFNAARNRTEHFNEQVKYWVEPRAERGTNMVHALELAYQAAYNWIVTPSTIVGQRDHRECFPPLIINVSDGENTAPGDIVGLSQQIQNLGTEQGRNLVFNCHFTAQRHDPVAFPPNRRAVEHLGNKYAPIMFDMSSPIPEALRQNAFAVSGQPVEPGARGMIFNANAAILVNFMNWGTIGNTEYR